MLDSERAHMRTSLLMIEDLRRENDSRHLSQSIWFPVVMPKCVGLTPCGGKYKWCKGGYLSVHRPVRSCFLYAEESGLNTQVSSLAVLHPGSCTFL